MFVWIKEVKRVVWDQPRAEKKRREALRGETTIGYATRGDRDRLFRQRDKTGPH